MEPETVSDKRLADTDRNLPDKIATKHQMWDYLLGKSHSQDKGKACNTH